MSPTVSVGEKKKKLTAIAEEIGDLTASPLYTYRQEHHYSAVPGEGDTNAELMLIGEAPGAMEAKTGRPFVGSSGVVLGQLLESIHLSREDVFITNIIKDRPPENRDPSVEEVRLYTPFLLRQIDIIQPKIIATLGRFAMDFILETLNLPEAGEKISVLHGKVLRGKAAHGEVWIVPLFYPAVALYTKEKQETLQQDFQVIGKLLSRKSR